jgi:hypothetical protein
MQWTTPVSFFLFLTSFTPPLLPQLGTPIGRCGVQPRDAAAPSNQLPPESVSLEHPKTHSLDFAKLQKDAQELAELSASIRSDIEHAKQGLLSKDVVERLKRIEKLSKHLRSELMR